MNTKLFLLLILLFWLAACDAAVEITPVPTVLATALPAATGIAIVATETAVPTELATAQPTLEPTAAASNGQPTETPWQTELFEIPLGEPGAASPIQPTWELNVALPAAGETVVLLQQPAQTTPLWAEEAATIARQFGFEALYVDVSGGRSLAEAANQARFLAFDETRTLSLSSPPYTLSDVANWNQGLDLPFAQAAPIAETYLRELGLLTFPYQIVPSSQGEGVLFLPLVEDVLLSSPAYAVQVAANGQVSGVSIYPLDNISPAETGQIVSAELAWQQLQTNDGQKSLYFNVIMPEAAVSPPQPITYGTIPPASEEGDFYNTVWVARPLSGDGLPVVQSNRFFRITGDADRLNELAQHTDGIVHLRGLVMAEMGSLPTLALTDWEATDMGSLRTVYGVLQQVDTAWFLQEDGSGTQYRLPNPPDGLQVGQAAAVSGLPQTAAGQDQLLWQEITVYPLPPTQPEPTAVPLQTISITAVQLVYLRLPATSTGSNEISYVPAWAFSGTANNGAQVVVWVTAVAQDMLTSSMP